MFYPYQGLYPNHTFLPNETMCIKADSNKTACRRIEIKNNFFNKRKERNRAMAAAQTQQDKIKVYCVGKEKDKHGRVVAYNLINNYGIHGQFDRNYMLEMLSENSTSYYECLNLQLDSLGRIVDKAIPNEKEVLNKLEKLSKVTDKDTIFEQAYFFTVNDGNYISCLFHNGKIDTAEPFDRIPNINIHALEKEFEEYMLHKHNYKPTKIKIVDRANNYEYIVWGSAYVDSTLLDKEYFVGCKSINDLEIACNYDKNTHEVYKKTATVKDPKTGKVIENAFIGLIIYDKNHEGAVNFAKDNIAEIEKQMKKISKSSLSGGKSRAGANLLKSGTASKGSTEPRSKTEETMNLINNSLRIAVNIKRLFK